MRRARNKIFAEHPELEVEMFELRKAGGSLRILARKYNVDWKCISTRCKKAGIEPLIPISSSSRKKIKETEGWYLDEFGEKVRKGMDYKDYLKAEERKKDPIHRLKIFKSSAVL
jgi:hypothetical protein